MLKRIPFLRRLDLINGKLAFPERGFALSVWLLFTSSLVVVKNAEGERVVRLCNEKCEKIHRNLIRKSLMEACYGNPGLTPELCPSLSITPVIFSFNCLCFIPSGLHRMFCNWSSERKWDDFIWKGELEICNQIFPFEAPKEISFKNSSGVPTAEHSVTMENDFSSYKPFCFEWNDWSQYYRCSDEWEMMR